MLFNTLFSKYLLENNYVSEEHLDEALQIAKSKGTPIYLELIRLQSLKENEAYSILANYLGFKYRMCQLTELSLELIKRFPREKMLEFLAIPFSEDENSITFITSNPFRVEEINQFKFYTNKKINIELVSDTQIRKILDYVDNKVQQDLLLDDYENKEKNNLDNDDSDVNIDAPIITLCDSILKEAVSRGASDIHIEPLRNSIKNRIRIDGVLTKLDDIRQELYPAILARFKIMAGMNIAERRVPQDGKINQEYNGKLYDFRVSTIPTIHGEKIVIRIYNVNISNDNLSKLGFNDEQLALIERMITRPHGIVLLTGPTGSGKSTTLYSFLRYLNNDQTNIITVEDPVENEIDGINQVQVNTKANLTFASALRSILRQDPNIIMIGEIRDEETAEIATRAAITGHLVLSTIHTNDVAGVVARLINMGIPKYLVADAILGAISQRLVRKLCPRCKKPHQTTLIENKILGLDNSVQIYEADGCPYCNNTGYLGRAGVFEIMIIDDEIRTLIMSDDFTTERLNKLLLNKMPTILDNTKDRILNGETSIEEYEKLSENIF